MPPKTATKAKETKAAKKATTTPKVEKKAAPKAKAEKVEKPKVEKPKVEKRKAPTTLEEFQEYADALVAVIDTEISRLHDSKEKGVKFLKSVRKDVLVLRNRAPKIAKQKKPKRQGSANGGFNKQRKPSDDLRKFLGLKADETVSQTEAANAIFVYVNLKDGEKREHMLRWKHLNPSGRCLQNKDNHSIIELDATLKKLLGYNEYVKKVKAGKVLRKNKETGKREPTKDTSVYYFMVPVLLQSHLEKIE